MSYLFEAEYDKVGIFILSNKVTVDYLNEVWGVNSIIDNNLFITIIQSAPPGIDQMDYFLDYITDIDAADPHSGLDRLTDDHLDIITEAIEINNEELINQITNRCEVIISSVPELIKIVHPHHSVFKIMYE